MRNTNHRMPVSSDEGEDDEEQNDEGSGDEVDGIYLGKKPTDKPEGEEDEEVEELDPFDISDDEDDEEEMAELRRRVLASKPFSNPIDSDQKQAPGKISRPVPLKDDSDVEPDSDNGEDDEFDNIINATPVTDRIGIQAKQRAKASEPLASAVFSRTIVGAPKKW
jgi:pre-rRNA-processing protein TSR3